MPSGLPPSSPPSPPSSPSSPSSSTFCDLNRPSVAAAPVATPGNVSPSPDADSGKQENSWLSKSSEAITYDSSVQLWYQRMISPNIGFLASHANEQSQRWSAAILKKKSAMRAMLEAQKTIEDIEIDVANILNRETLERLRSTFFRDIPDSSPDGPYLMHLEKAALRDPVSKSM